MKRTTRWLASLLSVILLLSLLPGAALAEETDASDPWDGAAEVASFDALKAAKDTEVSAIKITGDIEVTENIEVSQNILIATGKKADGFFLCLSDTYR